MFRIFLLSPARCGGRRARMVTSPRAAFPLARRLREPAGAPLGEVFAFLSGLYFRGKLAYARVFAAPPAFAEPVAAGGVLVIAPGQGLHAPETAVTVDTLRAFARVDVDADNPRHRRPLLAAAEALAGRIGPDCEVVLLGSIASRKYTEALGAALGDRLRFPAEFVGRGDMSRGGLLLRCVVEGRQLEYVPVAGAARHGRRPPRLAPLAPARRAP